MKILWLATAGVLAQFAPLATAADTKPLDIKAGLWETTTTETTEGMPAEQRARVDALLKSRAGAGSQNAIASKSCETTESRAAGSGDAIQALTKRMGCKQDIVSSTPSKRQTHMECSNPSSGLHSISDTLEERIDSEHINITIATQTEFQGKSWTQKISSMSRWVSAECGEVKPYIIK